MTRRFGVKRGLKLLGCLLVFVGFYVCLATVSVTRGEITADCGSGLSPSRVDALQEECKGNHLSSALTAR